MYIGLCDHDKLIEELNLQEVKTTTLKLNDKEYHPEGLLSEAIFGPIGSTQRLKRLGYIDLNFKFLSPEVYWYFSQVPNGSHYLSAINGIKPFYINNEGGLSFIDNIDSNDSNFNIDGLKGPNGEECGINCDFLYKNFDKWKIIKNIGKSDAKKTKSIRNILKRIPRDLMFTSKIIVNAAYYRDVTSDGSANNELNSYFNSLIRHSKILKLETDISGENTHTHSRRRIQQILLKHLMDMKNVMYGNRGFIAENIVTRRTVEGARLVCVGPSFNSQTPETNHMKFTNALLPLSHLLNSMSSIVIRNVRKKIEEFTDGADFLFDGDNIHSEKFTINDRDYFNNDFIIDKINRYIKDLKSRLEYVTQQVDYNGKVKELPIRYLDIRDNKLKKITWLELFYIVAYEQFCTDINNKKHILSIRYPFSSNDSQLLSEIDTEPVKENYCIEYDLNGSEFIYPYYPDMEKIRNDIDKNIISHENLYIEALRIHPLYYNNTNLDFDGDQMSIYGLSSNEANEDAKNSIYSKGNLLGQSGKIHRSPPMVVNHTIYALTRDPDIK